MGKRNDGRRGVVFRCMVYIAGNAGPLRVLVGGMKFKIWGPTTNSRVKGMLRKCNSVNSEFSGWVWR